MRKRTLTDIEIVDLYLSGTDSLTVALQANCDAQTVLNLVREAGGTVRRRGGRKPTRQLKIPIQEAVRLYQSGQSVTTVAQAAGVDPMTMRTRLRGAGVEIRSVKDVALLRRLQGRGWGRPPKG